MLSAATSVLSKLDRTLSSISSEISLSCFFDFFVDLLFFFFFLSELEEELLEELRFLIWVSCVSVTMFVVV